MKYPLFHIIYILQYSKRGKENIYMYMCTVSFFDKLILSKTKPVADSDYVNDSH